VVGHGSRVSQRTARCLVDWFTNGYPAIHSSRGKSMRGNIAAIVLVLLGVFFLLTNLGLISISLRELLRVWWPVALIAVGVALFFTPGKGR